MKARLITVWEQLRSSFWFVPSLMAAAAAVLAFATIALDEQVRFAVVRELGWIYTGGPDGARSLLSTVAGSVITVAGVTFSITIAALSLASSQFGPRLLRNFVRDRGNQLVLGTFIATFLYCLLVLRTVRGNDDLVFVPHVSVTIGVVLAVASMGVLIYFIHHVSVSIQADHVIAAVGHELDGAVDHAFPASDEHDEGPPRLQAVPVPVHEYPIVADDDGYVQVIDTSALVRLATKCGCVFQVVCRPGDYVVAGDTLAYSQSQQLETEQADTLRQSIVLGSQRSYIQDFRFVMNQLVEIGVRALSPGINDPFTAISCINELGAALCRVAERPTPSQHRCDEVGNLRLILQPVTVVELNNSVWRPIYTYGRSDAMVTLRILDMLATILQHTHDAEQQAALLDIADTIRQGSESSLDDAHDRDTVAARYRAVVKFAVEISAASESRVTLVA